MTVPEPPAALVAARCEFLRLDTWCVTVARHLPSSLDVIEGLAAKDEALSLDLDRLRRARGAVVDEIFSSTWWASAGNRVEAEATLRTAAVKARRLVVGSRDVPAVAPRS